MSHHAMDLDEFETEITVPESPRGVVFLIDADRRESARRRSTALADRFSAARYASCVLDLCPRRGIALVSSREPDEIGILVDRVMSATQAIRDQSDLKGLRIGHLVTGLASAASMLVAAADPYMVQAVVASNGRPDLADVRLHRVLTPSLFLVTSGERELWELNRWAQRRLSGPKKLEEVQSPRDLPIGAGLDELVGRAIRWFDTHLLRSNRHVSRHPARAFA